jgi:DNA (cytosine-5)-methyltransferase 1
MDRLNVVDLFCGAGGASLGFLKAGFDIVGAVDADEDAVDTYEQNLCQGDIVDEYPGDVRFDKPMRADLSRNHESNNQIDENIPTITFEDIRSQFDLEPGEVDVICGCPPCQNFSTLRDTEPWPEDKPKDNLLRAFVEFIEEEVPDIIFFENVKNIMNAGDEEPTTYVDWIERTVREITREGDSVEEGGYGVELEVLNTANYGVPQRRKRAIGLFVYGKDDKEISLPDQTHSESPDKDSDIEPWISVNEALSKHPDLKQDLDAGEKQVDIEGYPDDPEHRARNHHQKTIERMEAIRDHGWGWRDLIGTDDEEYIVEAHEDLDRGADSAYGIMDGESPAPTLTTRCTIPSCGRFTHPEKNRAITYREAALLMTFPRWFKLPSRNDISETLIGNAVPPELVKQIGDEITSLKNKAIL